MKNLPRKPIPCPECSSHNTVKNGGLNVYCKDCGRHFRTRSRPKKESIYPDRPSCPECGTANPVKGPSDTFKCKNCGRQFKQEYRRLRGLNPSAIIFDEFTLRREVEDA